MPTSTSPKGPPMTDDRLPLAELLAKSGDADFLRVLAESVNLVELTSDAMDGLCYTKGLMGFIDPPPMKWSAL